MGKFSDLTEHETMKLTEKQREAIMEKFLAYFGKAHWMRCETLLAFVENTLEAEPVAEGEECCEISGGAHWRDCPLYGHASRESVPLPTELPENWEWRQMRETINQLIRHLAARKD